MHVLLNRPLPPGGLERLQRIAPAATFRHETSADAIMPLLDWADVVYGNLPARALAGRPRLRWLQIVSSGFDDYAALAGGPVTVTTAHGVHAAAIAQQVLMAMLMFARGQLHFGECQRQRRWDRNPAIPFLLKGQTLGLVGYGAVGQHLVAPATLLGMRIAAVRRHAGECPPALASVSDLGGLDELLTSSDHLVVTLPLTPATRGLLDAGRIRRVKPGAYVYNVGRGGIVDEAALRARLEDGSLGGAAMDVFADEPLPPESPWWSAPRAILTPHIAGHHRDLAADVFEVFADNLNRFVTGRPLCNVADFGRGY